MSIAGLDVRALLLLSDINCVKEITCSIFNLWYSILGYFYYSGTETMDASEMQILNEYILSKINSVCDLR